MVEWQTVRLGNIASTNQRTYSSKEDWKFVNYLDTGNITMNQVDEIQYINTSMDKLPSRAKRKVRFNSIIYSTVRPNQLHYGIIKNQPENFLVSSGFTVIDVDFDKAIPEYIYYVLTQQKITEYLQSIAEQSVSAYPSIKPSDIENLEVPQPDRKTQEKIVSILKSIDEKIVQNNEINNNLLQQSLYIFETLINSASKDGCIGDYCTLKSGFAFKSKWWQDSGIPVIKIGSINQDYLNLSNCSHVSEDKISLAKDFIVSGGDLLIAMTGATIGKFTMVPKMHKTILVNQRVGKFFLGENPINKIPFIYCTLKQPEIISEIINRGQGSAQPNISASDIMSIPCVIPQTDEINNFNLQTAPMFELIINNQFENLILAKTRDLLLPRLMSGEIDISNISF
mgnify:CR=1 FL=1